MTKRTTYAALFLLDLTVGGEEAAVTISRVARRHGISEKYLWIVASALARAGLVAAVRGPSGGFRLARPARDVTLAEIVEASEGMPLPTVKADHLSQDRAAGDVIADTWAVVADQVRNAFAQVRLSELAERYRERVAQTQYDFQI